MRVGFDVRPAQAARAGIGRYCRELLRALAALADGPELELYALGRHPRRAALPRDPGGRLHLHDRRFPARILALLHRLPGLDAGRLPARVDLFHWTDYVYPPVRSAARVLTLHDASFLVDPAFHGRNTPVLRRRLRRVLPGCARVLVPSPAAREDALRLGVPPGRIRVVPDGVAPLFRPAPDSDPGGAGPLLTVGTVEPRKNHLRVLRALERLWERDAAPDWWILGRPGWDLAPFREALERSRHRHRVRWLQDADDEELLRALQGASALVYPSLHEGFGLPVLEAMACGLPVLVGAGTAPAWVAGPAAVTVEARSVEALEAALAALCAGPEERRERGRRLRERAATFSWAATARGTLAVYREALETACADNGARGGAGA